MFDGIQKRVDYVEHWQRKREKERKEREREERKRGFLLHDCHISFVSLGRKNKGLFKVCNYNAAMMKM